MNYTSTKKSLGKAFFIWGLAASFVLYQFLLQATPSVMLPCLEKSLHINLVQTGFLSSSFFYTYLFMQIPSGLLIDRLGTKRFLPLCVATCGIACLFFGHAHNLALAESMRLLMGVVTAPAVCASLYLGAHWFPARFFALIAGLTEMLGMIGGALGAYFLSQCVDGPLGWRGTLYLCAGIGLSLAFLMWLFLEECPKTPKAGCPEKLPMGQALKILFTLPQAWYCGLYTGLMFAVIAAFASFWSVSFIEDVYHVGVIPAGATSAWIFIGAALGAPLFGLGSDKQKKRRPAMWMGSLMSLFFMSLILWLPPHSLLLLKGLFFCLGFSCSSYVLSFAVMKESVQASIQSTAMGYTNMMCIALGAPLLQPLIAEILTTTSGNPHMHYTQIDYQYALLILPIVLAIAGVLVFFIKETHCIEQSLPLKRSAPEKTTPPHTRPTTPNY